MYWHNLLKKHTYVNLILFFLWYVIVIFYIYQKLHTDYTKLQKTYIHELNMYQR